MDAAAEFERNPVSSTRFSRSMEMSRLTRDGTAEPVSRDQILRRNADRIFFIFPVQLTTSRIGNLTRLIHTLTICDDQYIYRYNTAVVTHISMYLVSLCDDRNCFACVCIKHGVFQSWRSKSNYCCVAQAFNYNKRYVFSIVARFRVPIPAAMST